MTAHSNNWESLAREQKALMLVVFLMRCKITAEDAEGASPEDWKLAAQGAGVRPPSEQTQRRVIELLRERQAA